MFADADSSASNADAITRQFFPLRSVRTRSTPRPEALQLLLIHASLFQPRAEYDLFNLCLFMNLLDSLWSLWKRLFQFVLDNHKQRQLFLLAENVVLSTEQILLLMDSGLHFNVAILKHGGFNREDAASLNDRAHAGAPFDLKASSFFRFVQDRKAFATDPSVKLTQAPSAFFPLQVHVSFPTLWIVQIPSFIASPRRLF